MRFFLISILFIPFSIQAQELEGIWLNNSGERESHRIERITFFAHNGGCYTGNLQVLQKGEGDMLTSALVRDFAVHCKEDDSIQLIMLDGDHEERTLKVVKENGFVYLRVPEGDGFKKNNRGHYIEFVPVPDKE